jgi:hypothetical protein
VPISAKEPTRRFRRRRALARWRENENRFFQSKITAKAWWGCKLAAEGVAIPMRVCRARGSLGWLLQLSVLSRGVEE